MRVIVQESPIHGQGVFAGKLLTRGTWAPLPGELKFPRHVDYRYAVEWDDLLAFDPGPPYRYMNHSEEPNCELRHGEESIRVVVLKDIPPGAELTIDYGYALE